MAASLLGAAGLAQSQSYGADAAEASAQAATSRVNARRHGARGDGKADDSKALQAALNAAETNGPVCLLGRLQGNAGNKITAPVSRGG